MNQNPCMSERTKRNMSERLKHLMRETPGLDTLEKVAERSGVSYGTVRRIKTAAENDVQIGHAEAVAKAFRLSLIDFVADFDAQTEIRADERELIENLRCLQEDDRAVFRQQIARMAMLQKANAVSTAIEQSQEPGRRRSTN